MYREDNSKQLLIVGLSIVVLISLTSLILVLDTGGLTGHLIADGGSITNMSINQSASTMVWSVLYGVFDETTGVSSYNFSGGLTIRTNFSSYGYDSSMVVVAHTSSFNQSNISQASPSLIDTYLGVGPAFPESGTNTFSDLFNISIGDQTFELYGTQTIADAGTFITAAFLSNGNLGFVTTTQNGTAFDGSSAFFQFMLPVNGVENYSFEVISNITCPQIFEINGTLSSDNRSIILNWTDLPGKVIYEVYSVDGYNASHYVEFDPLDAINTSSNIFIEDPESYNRFYQVRTYLTVYSCDSQNKVGLSRINLTPTANLISFPYQFVNNSVEELISPIYDHFVSLNRYNNTDQNYDFYIKFMGSIFNNFDTVNNDDGYWITVNNTLNLTLVGTVSSQLSTPIYNRSNLVGFPIIEGNNTVAYALRSIDGNYSTVNVYDNLAKSFDFYIIFGGSVFNNFNEIDPTLGYWILANETENLVLP